MAFGVYIHIPYCLQICPYCDFTKYEFDKIMPPENYVDLLKQEIRCRAGEVRQNLTSQMIDTIYFGGGTPSLFAPPLILSVIDELANAGLVRSADAEVTLEIDPATVDAARLESYLKIGINRFSVGAQTFNSRLLKIAGRKHSSEDTIGLLHLLRANKVNYSFDLLFALPTQTLAEVRADLATAIDFQPAHLSAYCLTVGEEHPMARGRAPDEEQVEMFSLIERELAAAGVLRYEISNFARPGFNSRHNMLYWTDQNYWGLGTGAHSYFSSEFEPNNPWGLRFWNAPSLQQYARDLASHAKTNHWRFSLDTEASRREILLRHQALTDFCHTSLRLSVGLAENALRLKFGAIVTGHVAEILDSMVVRGLVDKTGTGWCLTESGRVVANQVFSALTFLPEDLRGL